MSEITVLGIFVADISFSGNKIPTTGETILGDSYNIGPGGKGCNQAISISRLGGKVNFISKKNIEKKSSTKKSQGVILYLDDNYQSSVEEMIFLADRKNEVPLIIFLDRVQDPHNLGAIARTAEIFGAHGIVVPSRNSAKISPGAIRASAGALEHVEFSIVNSIAKTLDYLKNMNFNIISLDMSGENIQDTKIDPLKPIALVVGSEHDGISDDVLKISDNIVSIPMKGEVSSLNVSVATGITLYTIFLKRN